MYIYPSVVKRVGLTAGSVETQKHCTQGGKKKMLVSAMAVHFPQGKQPKFHGDKKVI